MSIRAVSLCILVLLSAATARAESAQPKPKINPLVEKLKSAKFEEVEAAVSELVAANDPDGAALLGSLYSNGDAQRRLLAIRALARVAPPKVEEPLFRVVLDYAEGNQSRAAGILGINRGTLRKKLKELGLSGGA